MPHPRVSCGTLPLALGGAFYAFEAANGLSFFMLFIMPSGGRWAIRQSATILFVTVALVAIPTAFLAFSIARLRGLLFLTGWYGLLCLAALLLGTL